MSFPKELESYLENNANKYNELADKIWSYAEIAYNENSSAEALASCAEEEGFCVKRNLAGIKTAFSASFGSGKPHIAFLGEFDALSGLSQKAGETKISPITEGGNGHGCGHNLLGTGSLAAAAAVKEYLKSNGIQGTVTFFGCPAEEGGSGKAFMAREGVFSRIDAALTWHPGDTNAVMAASTLANIEIACRFTGKSAHAAAAPYLGRSALDAVELMNVGINYLREHIIPEAKIHYAITDTGGVSPNVVQRNAEAVYLIRAPKIIDACKIMERVTKIAQGASLMTETTVETRFIKACSDFVQNKTLQELLYNCFVEIGSPKFSQAEIDMANAFKETFDSLPVSQIYTTYARMIGKECADKLKPYLGKEINDFVIPYKSTDIVMPASTDVGDVSHICPVAQIGTVTCAANTPGHSWQMVSQGCSSLAHNGMLQASKILAYAGIKLFTDKELLDKARLEFESNSESSYSCPIPNDVEPGCLSLD